MIDHGPVRHCSVASLQEVCRRAIAVLSIIWVLVTG